MKRKKIENYIVFMQELLGEGSFGRVYKGLNEATNEPIAVKVLDKKTVDEDSNLRNALFLEIQIMKKFNSKYIVRILDFLSTDHNYYIVQEYCNGTDLKSAIKRAGSFTQQIALKYLNDICMGFIELISEGVIHRDVKPQNIILHNDTARIADFGFAKSVVSNTQMNFTVVGTPYYMSPQQLRLQRYTSKCDIWAIGLIYYEVSGKVKQMLYGRLPWTANSEYQLLQNILNQPLEFPPFLNGRTPIGNQSKSFIRGCLGIDESSRFSWQDLYSHPLIAQSFLQFSGKIRQFNHRLKYVMTRIRQDVHQRNIDIEAIRKKMGLTSSSVIGFQQFEEFMKRLHPAIDIDETRYIFDSLDKHEAGKIVYESLVGLFKQNQINLTPFQNIVNSPMKKASGLDQESIRPRSYSKDPFAGEKIRIKANVALKKFRHRLEAKNYDIREVYNTYDRNKDEKLSRSEFKKLFSKIDSQLTEEEIDVCFKYFDENSDGGITFNEFRQGIDSIPDV